MVSEEELADMDARAAAATPGVWEAKHRPIGVVYEVTGIVAWSGRGPVGHDWIVDHPPVSVPLFQGRPEEQAANMEFCAHARQDVPTLLAEVRRLRTRLARYEEPDGTPVEPEPEAADVE